MARMGRPTKLTQHLIDRAWEYVDTNKNVSSSVLLPCIEGLALELDISKNTLYQWELDNEDFQDVLNTLRNAQANKLIQNSVVNRYNPTISKLLLSKHDYIEKKETDITTKGESINQMSEEERQQRSDAIDKYLENEE